MKSYEDALNYPNAGNHGESSRQHLEIKLDQQAAFTEKFRQNRPNYIEPLICVVFTCDTLRKIIAEHPEYFPSVEAV